MTESSSQWSLEAAAAAALIPSAAESVPQALPTNAWVAGMTAYMSLRFNEYLLTLVKYNIYIYIYITYNIYIYMLCIYIYMIIYDIHITYITLLYFDMLHHILLWKKIFGHRLRCMKNLFHW